ncbi:hypothetical protein LTR56_004100 [Elasticomyces elasticus]|nr:hypothetical protein LTR56_004100 [Elasticomyces elasticus]KAK3661337.1 hypothetical protein LTR22_007544 [Elasticomyces elasticus]KAK4928968.1 hypothetical protein LTR49_004469 [Elasticomyces elasticus]KAK5765366.1 hypothetical protein LTS12_004379 [Elasticomyces elasticus]
MGKHYIPWAQHWDKIVRLYHDPHYSLTKLMKELEKDGFKVSRRAYCYKLKEEGLSGMGVTRSATTYSSAMDLDKREPSPESLLELDLRKAASTLPQQRRSENELSDPHDVDPNLYLNKHFLGSEHEREEVEQYIRGSTSSQGTETVLHRCVRLLECNHQVHVILAVMRKAELNVDVPDDKGRTALRLAVDLNKPWLVDMLLNAGASVNTKDAVGDSPLHASVRPPIFAMASSLLHANAEVCSPNLAGDSPLRVLVNVLSSTQDKGERRDALNLVDKFLDHGSYQQDGTSLEIYLSKIWLPWRDCQWNYIYYKTLKKFLAKGCSPFHLIDAKGCSGHCRTLADLAAYHDPGDDLWDIVASSNASIPERAQELMEVLFERPCRYRCIDIFEHVHSLFVSGFLATSGAQLDALRMILMSGDSRLKQKTLGAFVEYDIFDKIWPVRVLLEIVGDRVDRGFPDSNDYALAEVLMSQDVGLAATRQVEDIDLSSCLFVHHPGLEYLQYLSPRYRQYLQHYLNNSRAASVEHTHDNAEMVVKVHKTVLDLLTKRMISDKLPDPQYGTLRSRVVAALQIRRSLNLPDVAMDSGSVITWISLPIEPGSEEAEFIRREAVGICQLVDELRIDENWRDRLETSTGEHSETSGDDDRFDILE